MPRMPAAGTDMITHSYLCSAAQLARPAAEHRVPAPAVQSEEPATAGEDAPTAIASLA